MERKYILRHETTRDNNTKEYSFVVLMNNNLFYLTYNPNDATRFDSIGDAMKKIAEINEKNASSGYKVIDVWN